MKLIKHKSVIRAVRNLGMSVVLASAALATGPASATTPLDFDIHGNTITFNYHDWFQVQDSRHFRTFCEGWQPCTVPDGDYIVINHNYNERYHVTIGKGGSTGGGGTGGGSTGATQTITWPNNGWYQVQDSTTLATICEGGRSCVVHPGTYYVINLTTHHRTTVVVSGGTTTPPPSNPHYSDFTISGNTIKFTAHGWFQVQNQHTYAPVCEGFHPCHAPAGVYQIINHTTGRVWKNVRVH